MNPTRPRLLAALLILASTAASAAEEKAPRGAAAQVDAGLAGVSKMVNGWKDCLTKRKAEEKGIRDEYEAEVELLKKAGEPKIAAVPVGESKPSKEVAPVSAFDQKKHVDLRPVKKPASDVYAKCEAAFDPRAAMAKKRFGNEFQYYYLCKAIATHDAKQCQNLNDLHNPRYNFAEECEEAYNHVQFAKYAMERSPKAMEFCAPLLTHTFHLAPQEISSKGNEICGAFIKHDVEGGCGALNDAATVQSGFLKPFEDCPRDLKACLYGETRKEVCPGGCINVFNLRQAKAKGGPDACGDDSVCRVLMGQGASACDISIKLAKEEFCNDPVSWDPEFSKPLTEKAKKADADRAATEAAAAAAKQGVDKTLASPATPNTAALQTADSVMRSKIQALDKTCANYPSDIRAELDKVFLLMSDPVFRASDAVDERRERYDQLHARYNALYKSSFGAPPAAPKKAK